MVENTIETNNDLIVNKYRDHVSMRDFSLFFSLFDVIIHKRLSNLYL